MSIDTLELPTQEKQTRGEPGTRAEMKSRQLKYVRIESPKPVYLYQVNLRMKLIKKFFYTARMKSIWK